MKIHEGIILFVLGFVFGVMVLSLRNYHGGRNSYEGSIKTLQEESAQASARARRAYADTFANN